MLEFVKIDNLALMDRECVEFSEGFTVFTGETGAGKSVLLGALALLAGNRAGREVVGARGDSCTVQGQISFADTSEVDAFLAEHSLPPCEDGALVLSRSIFKTKSARAAVNGTATTLSVLAKLGQMWVDFHGANEPQKLFSEKNQLSMLDSFAHNDELTSAYLRVFAQYKKLRGEIETLRNSKKLSPDELEFLRKRISEIEKLNPTEESIAELETLSKTAEMAGEIVEKASEISALLLSEDGAAGSIASANRLAQHLARAGENADALRVRLEQVSVEVADIAQEYERLARGCNMSAAAIENVRSRMSTWLSLRRKYGATVAEVLAAKDEMKRRIETQSDIGATLDRFEFESEKILRSLAPLAERVLKSRRAAAQKLAAGVLETLVRLGFKKPRFEVEITPSDGPSGDCQSSCSFKFSANAGHAVAELAKIASSGEMARVMLAIKTVLAEQDKTPVLVFDEVDANVGGEIGAEVGAQLARLSAGRQVFCVTHLPQVAARGDNHFVVSKTQTENSTSVSISHLGAKSAERVAELSRMLGDRHDKTAIEMARKLLGA